ncbi:MAG: MlaE family lipid ABC transporter permease subunit [Pseudomonadota bacterium]
MRSKTRVPICTPATVVAQDNQLRATGTWTAFGLGKMGADLGLDPASRRTLDLTGIDRFDTTGAWLVQRAVQRFADAGGALQVDTTRAQRELLDLVGQHQADPADLVPPTPPGVIEEIGRDTFGLINKYLTFLAFIGRLTFTAVRVAFTPHNWRWRTIIRGVEEAGFNALPIVGLLSFLLGLVIAYQSGVALQAYNGSIFVADLVGLAMLRELAPLITAIIVAGRTGSAYTAQIATMKVTEEVDALRTLGVAPLEALALPKFFALVISLPLLAVFADLMGILGGMFMANAMFDMSFGTFVQRLNESVSLSSFLIGIGKAPIFALMIAAVGCYQGFEADSGAEQVGRHTTTSVVHAIFLVIVVDAVFAIVFSKVGL